MSSRLLPRAKRLRSEQTDAEAKLWQMLRAGRLEGWKFKRQQPVGNYIVDFVCFERRVIIEVDGGQHQDAAVYDLQRDQWLHQRGFKVLRFWNNQVMQNPDGVLQSIVSELSPSPQPSPVKGEGADHPSPLAGEGPGERGRR